MKPRLYFTVPGVPQATQRPRVFLPKGGRFPVATTPPETREYQKRVELHTRAAVQLNPAWAKFVAEHPRGRIYRLHVHFVIPADRGDLDNYAKVADAMNGVAWKDDRQIHQSLTSLTVDPREEHHTEVLVEIAMGPLEEPLWQQIAKEHGWARVAP